MSNEAIRQNQFLQNYPMKYEKSEVELLNATFSDEFGNNLKLVRKFLLQGELSQAEQENLNAIMSENVIALFKKVFIPEIDPDIPIQFHLNDPWVSVEITDRNVDHVFIELETVQLAIDYLSQRFKCLINKSEDDRDIKFSDLKFHKDKEPHKAIVDLAARNMLIARFNLQFNLLKGLAGDKIETQKEREARLFKNSTK